jgi:hypothetical protein
MIPISGTWQCFLSTVSTKLFGGLEISACRRKVEITLIKKADFTVRKLGSRSYI